MYPPRQLWEGFSVIQNGDLITLDVHNRSLSVALTDEDLALRKQQRETTSPIVDRGYVNLYVTHVQQADLGADLDFLRGKSGSDVPRDSH